MITNLPDVSALDSRHARIAYQKWYDETAQTLDAAYRDRPGDVCYPSGGPVPPINEWLATGPLWNSKKLAYEWIPTHGAIAQMIAASSHRGWEHHAQYYRLMVWYEANTMLAEIFHAEYGNRFYTPLEWRTPYAIA